MPLPGSLQSVKSPSQLLTVVAAADADQNGCLDAAETQSLFAPQDQSEPGAFFSRANKNMTTHLELYEIAAMMHHSGPPLNKLFSTAVVDDLKRITNKSLHISPLHPEVVNEWVGGEQSGAQLRASMIETAELLSWSFADNPGGNEFSKQFIDQLTPSALFLLLAVAGSDLWSPLFTRAAERLESTPDLQDVIKTVDPSGDLLSEFFLQMVAYGRSRNYLTRIKEPIYAAVTRVAHSQDAYLIPRILPALEVLAAFDRATADELGDALLGYYNEGSTGKAGIQFLLWSLRKYWRFPEVKKVALAQKELVTPPVPESWLADGELWAVVVFTDDQKAHRDLLIRMFQQQGFALTRRNGDTTIKERAVLEKTVDGILLGLEVLYGPKVSSHFESSFQFANLVRGRADIISIRAHHSSALHYLSQCRFCAHAGKLIFNGGCTGVDSVPELMSAYRGNFFIADKNTGRGHDNNLALYHVMRAIARGATDWGQVHRSVKAHVPLRQMGLLLPDDDLLKYYYALDAPVFLPQVQDPFADSSTWVLGGNDKEPPGKPKGKIKLGKMKVLRP